MEVSITLQKNREKNILGINYDLLAVSQKDMNCQAENL